MPTIILETKINAPIERCFDLARSIELHEDGASKTKEKAIAGVTSGIIELGEKVTWKAKHFGIWQKLTVEIIEVEKPFRFTDEMKEGAFKAMKHTHSFEERNGMTIMTDKFVYKSPFSFLGLLIDWLFLEKYMTKFLLNKNVVFKSALESNVWQNYIKRINQ